MDSKRTLSRLLTNQEDGVWDPLALAAKSNSVDTYTWNEAMNSPHAKGFREAATIEHNALAGVDGRLGKGETTTMDERPTFNLDIPRQAIC